MAGFGECCSHIASLLWAMESAVRSRESLTVTKKKAYWAMPTSVKEVPYAPIKKIKFQGKKASKADLIKTHPGPSSSSSNSSFTHGLSLSPSKCAVSVPSSDEMSKLYEALASCPSSPAILALVDPHYKKYIPKSLDEDLPSCLMNLYEPDNRTLNYNDLMEVATRKSIIVSEDEAIAVEMKTRDQARSRLWFRMRAGRTTASKFKVACSTDPSSPSLSLVMSICYPERMRFSSDATSWGCSHETTARKSYEDIMSKSHANFKVCNCGFFISTSYPFLGASPDGLISCTCCDKGICEVKVSHACTYITSLFVISIIIIVFILP